MFVALVTVAIGIVFVFVRGMIAPLMLAFMIAELTVIFVVMKPGFGISFSRTWAPFAAAVRRRENVGQRNTPDNQTDEYHQPAETEELMAEGNGTRK